MRGSKFFPGVHGFCLLQGCLFSVALQWFSVDLKPVSRNFQVGGPPPHPPTNPPLDLFTCCKKCDLILLHTINTISFFFCRANNEDNLFAYCKYCKSATLHCYFILLSYASDKINPFTCCKIENPWYSQPTSGSWFLWLYWPHDWFYTCISIITDISRCPSLYTNDRSSFQMQWSLWLRII